METPKRQQKILFLCLGLLIIFSAQVSGFGVATPYFKGNELQLHPGQTVSFNLTLQNMVGNRDLRFNASVPSSSKEFLTLLDQDTIYLVPLGRDDVQVPLQISIPLNMNIGDLAFVEVSFTQTDANNQGTVSFATSFNTQIPLIVVGKEESTFQVEENNLREILLSILALLILLFVIIDMSRKKGK